MLPLRLNRTSELLRPTSLIMSVPESPLFSSTVSLPEPAAYDFNFPPYARRLKAHREINPFTGAVIEEAICRHFNLPDYVGGTLLLHLYSEAI